MYHSALFMGSIVCLSPTFVLPALRNHILSDSCLLFLDTPIMSRTLELQIFTYPALFVAPSVIPTLASRSCFISFVCRIFFAASHLLLCFHCTYQFLFIDYGKRSIAVLCLAVFPPLARFITPLARRVCQVFPNSCLL